MTPRVKQRERYVVLKISAIVLAFFLGISAAWWVTSQNADANSGAGGTEPDAGILSSDGNTSDSSDEIFTVPSPNPDLESPEFLSPRPPEPEPDPTFTEEDIIKTGSGKFSVAGGDSDATGPDPQKYRVEVEEGLPFDADVTAKIIDEILGDPRGWTAQGKHQLQRVTDDSFDFRTLIASPDTVDKLCAPLRTLGKVSCGRDGRATLNAIRWAVGADSFADDLDNYRRYLVNHEVGHLLGYPHESCPNSGELAPIMVQQTRSTEGCLPNPWPHPNAD